MILNLFPKCKCENCKKKITRDEVYELKYKTLEGLGIMRLCKDCASILVDMKKEMDELYGETIDDNTI